RGRDAAHDDELSARSKSLPSFARTDCREALARPAAPSPARGPQAARFCRPVPGYHRRARSPAVSGAWVFLPASLVGLVSLPLTILPKPMWQTVVLQQKKHGPRIAFVPAGPLRWPSW